MKKKYIVYFRWLVMYQCNHWRVWQKYKTKKASEDALRSLCQKHKTTMEFKI